MIWEVIGWLAWALVAYVAVTFAYGCRVYAASGEGFQWATAIQTFFAWCIAIAFVVGPWNKLHILWLAPLGYFSAPYLVLVRVPVISSLLMFVTRTFMAVVLAGVTVKVLRLLFVCHGNTCRSPMAAGLASRVLAGHVKAESAGIDATRGASATAEAIRVMQRESVDLSGHRSRHVSDVSLGDFAFIVAMAPSVARYLKERCQVALERLISWDIDDPLGQGNDAYTKCFQAISPRMQDLRVHLRLPADEDRPR